MQITQVTVSYSELVSLGDYCNAKPQISMTATVEEGENPAEVRKQLNDMVKRYVHSEIDVALEANGQAPKYYSGPRYLTKESDKRRFVVVAPVGTDWPKDFSPCGYYDEGVVQRTRFEVAAENARRYADDNHWHLLVFERVEDIEWPPIIPRYSVYVLEDDQQVVIQPSDWEAPGCKRAFDWNLFIDKAHEEAAELLKRKSYAGLELVVKLADDQSELA